jgi:metallophosphoesterase (TIGR00282 family)
MKNILFIGDIVGEEGMHLVLDLLPRIKYDYKTDCVIANGENVNKGKGLTQKQAQELNKSGIAVITSGNHIWSTRNEIAAIEKCDYVLRPHNYPDDNPGKGVFSFEFTDKTKITVINLQGRSFMYPIDCPFRAADEIISGLSQQSPVIIIDLHAESTAEKQAFAYYVNGRVSAVIGTHTHVQTADERILSGGTGYITDAGMTGPNESVIGMDVDTAIKRFKYQTPFYYKQAIGDLRFNGVLLRIDEKSTKTSDIQRLNFSKAEYDGRKTNRRKNNQ